jgi:serine protease Do
VNIRGEAIGINSAILSPTGGNIGIGFAIPSNMAKKVINDLKTEGRVVRGYLGVQITEITESEAAEFDLPVGGVLIAKVEPDTPADKAGLKRYDLIVKVNGRDVKTANELRTMIANFSPGDGVELKFYRDEDLKTVTVRVGEAPDSISVMTREEDGTSVDLGMVLTDNSPALARRYNLTENRGIVVTEVARGGLAHQNGVRTGDVILAVNRTEIESVSQFRRLLRERSAGSSFFLYVNRGGEEIFIRFRLP